MAPPTHTPPTRAGPGEFILVLEDVRPSVVVGDEDGDPAPHYLQTPMDLTHGTAVSTVEQAIDVVTQMHVKLLNDPALLEHRWIFGAGSVATRKLQPEVFLTCSYLPESWKVTRRNAAAGEYVGMHNTYTHARLSSNNISTSLSRFQKFKFAFIAVTLLPVRVVGLICTLLVAVSNKPHI